MNWTAQKIANATVAAGPIHCVIETKLNGDPSETPRVERPSYYGRVIARRLLGLSALAVVSCWTLTACSPGIPVAYHVTEDAIDIAFCDSFTATSVVIDFGKYPPPFMGTLYSIAVQSASGPEAAFGDGKPVSTSIEGWEFSSDSDQIPDDWERIDFSFYGADGEYVGGTHLFDDDVTSSDWAWTSGYNMSSPRCELDLP